MVLQTLQFNLLICVARFVLKAFGGSMKQLSAIFFTLIISLSTSFAHEMQHGFILSDDNKFFSHLVANGHHSHQLSFSGELSIPDEEEAKNYEKLKELNSQTKNSYFLFQAQKLNLPATHEGQILEGHIVQSTVGDYEPKNIIVNKARIIVQKVHINVVNPFFGE